MSIKAVIWDLGGVLVRTEDYTTRREMAGQLGLTLAELEDIVFDGETGGLAQHGQLSVEEHWQAVARRLGLGPADLLALQDAFWGGDRLDEELIAYIRGLRPRYCTALLSNAFSDLRQTLLEKWRCLDAFDEVMISSEERLAKPDPAIFLRLLERLHVAPHEAVFVDDFAHNTAGARAVGMHTILFQNPAQARADLEALLAREAGEA